MNLYTKVPDNSVQAYHSKTICLSLSAWHLVGIPYKVRLCTLNLYKLVWHMSTQIACPLNLPVTLIQSAQLHRCLEQYRANQGTLLP